MKEVRRQYVHIILALLTMALLLTLGRTETMLALFLALIFGSLIINLKFLNKKIPLIDFIVDVFERDKTRFVGYGSAWFVTGCLIPIVFLTDINQIITILWILGIGDGFATLFGIKGKRKLFYNKKKTLEGSTAFFLSALPAYSLVGPIAIPLALATAIIESLPIPLDDNASIPLVGILILSLGM